jgi:hypothetical protein
MTTFKEGARARHARYAATKRAILLPELVASKINPLITI